MAGRPPQDHLDIEELLMPTFSDDQDQFGKEVVPPLPLSLDRVLEGRKPSSGALLFRLPFEILSVVLDFVPDVALSTLAFVNSDCRQLARSRQFVGVRFDFSDHTLSLINKLLIESVERLQTGSLTKKPALGPCVRRLVVATNPTWLTHRYDVEMSETFRSLPNTEQIRRLTAASGGYFGDYLPSVGALLSCRATVPHLELLDWKDRISLQPALLTALATSSIQHLKLDPVSLNEKTTAGLKSIGHWPLRNLEINVVPTFPMYDENDLAPLFLGLLKLCSPTLQSLAMDAYIGSTFQSSSITTDISFPSLRHFKIGSIKFEDNDLIHNFLHDDLQSLSMITNSTSKTTQFLEIRGQIPRLNILVWDLMNAAEGQSMTFLHSNPQLAKLDMKRPLPPNLLADCVLPQLISSFAQLSSLSLKWDSKQIPVASIEMITQIRTLRQLHLSAGCQAGWRHDWLIDHPVMQLCLPKLPFLKKVAFSRDSYAVAEAEECDRYYEHEWQRLMHINDEGWTADGFELAHRLRMAREAAIYIQKMPQLEWLYFGQHQMTVEWDARKERRVVFHETHERDDCWTLLRDMFGWKGLFPV